MFNIHYGYPMYNIGTHDFVCSRRIIEDLIVGGATFSGWELDMRFVPGQSENHRPLQLEVVCFRANDV